MASRLAPLERKIHAELEATVYQLRTMVRADRAGLFFIDGDELWFSIDEEDIMIRIPKTSGIAGAVATSGMRLVVKDAYDDHRFNRSVDAKTGYRTKSILCVPVKNLAGRVVAVIQMINKQKGERRVDLTGLSTREDAAPAYQIGHGLDDQQGGCAESKGSFLRKKTLTHSKSFAVPSAS